MNHLKVLIVDDEVTNRALLTSICESMDAFEIREAEDGAEAIECTEEWHPHIILMDIMMPRLDGFAASRIIKKMYPEVIIIAISSLIDKEVEHNIASIGINAYVHKPINNNLVRYKLQSFIGLFDCNESKSKALSKNLSLNLFGVMTRHFKTNFEIIDTEAMMDFGMWILMRCDQKATGSCTKIDATLELFYRLMSFGLSHGNALSIIIEESFEDMYVTMKFEKTLMIKDTMISFLETLGNEYLIRDNVVSIRFPMQETNSMISNEKISVVKELPVLEKTFQSISDQDVEIEKESKEIRTITSKENQLLRQSFAQKTTARDYVRDIGGDVLDEIRDLASLEEEWKDTLGIVEKEPSLQNIEKFTNKVLGVYVHAINSLFEFTALAYALSALSTTLKEHSNILIGDSGKLKKTLMLLEHLGDDLAAWREHVFTLQDTQDIHYLDSSFFSSCMQIEGIVSDKQIEADDDDNDMEFF